MYEVTLPALDWFLNGNIYSGSFRPDATRGSLCQTTFHFKVKIVMQNEKKALLAYCYFVFPWNQSVAMQEYTVGMFEASEFGIATAQQWIRSKFILSDFDKLLIGKENDSVITLENSRNPEAMILRRLSAAGEPK